MDPKQQQQIKQYLSIALRWKKLILGCFLVAVVIGIGVYVKTPKVYKAQALLVYQRGKIDPSNKLTPDLTQHTREVVDTLREQVLSHTSLEEIIKKFNLYTERLKVKPLEDVMATMRSKDIEIRIPRGETFTVSFQGDDPKKVTLVTNALASKFVEENLRFRAERATETSAYIQDELAMAKKAIENKEASMRDYKLKYYNEMPEQRSVNIDRLNALQTNYQDIQSSMQELERTKIMVQEQISLRKNALQKAAENNQLPEALGSDSTSEAGLKYGQAVNALNAARSELESLLTHYTPQHPEVRRQQMVVDQLKARVAEAAKALPAAKGEDQKNPETSLPFADKQLSQLELQLKEIAANMSQLRKEREDEKKQIGIFQQWIAAAPVREAEWADLTRDYQQFSKRYQNLVAKNMAAESVESLERKQKGSQFKIIDPAHMPEKPFKPDLIKILVIAVIMGMGAGATVAFCLEFVDTSFKDAHDLEKYLGMPIICSVPLLLTPKEEKRQMIKNMSWLAIFILALAGLTGGIIYLREKGVIIF